MVNRAWKILAVGTILLVLVVIPSPSRPVVTAQPAYGIQFTEVAPQGFGDRQNSGTWSMQWWNGKLYVGTVRAWFCWSQAAFHYMHPDIVPYPPNAPDLDCTPDARDLPLQAEIWRYTPETGAWERVYQSPKDVEIPGSPGKYIGREVGYRDMIVLEETDGTEALYVAGATANSVWPGLPPPRILRSTDGETFEAIPQDPGTVLGDLGEGQSTFRDFEIYNGRLYVLNGNIRGHGMPLETENPAGGNDEYRWVTMQDVQVFEMCPYNGYLYLGLSAYLGGYSVLKTDATGTPPYTLTPVVTNGGFRLPTRSPSVVSMHVFKDRLYVGTDQPVEVIRINPDDSWDLIVGNPRYTPDGQKYPLSGMGSGFDWPLAGHLWRMQAYQDKLYLSTHDYTTALGQAVPELEDEIGWQYGFDLYETPDGQYLRPITVTGFDDKFQAGVRTLASTPYGLFVGTVSWWYGLRVWKGTESDLFWAFLPYVTRSGEGTAQIRGNSSDALAPVSLHPRLQSVASPERLEAEGSREGNVLSWEPSIGAVRFRILRSEATSNRSIGIPEGGADTWVPSRFVEIGTTDQSFFVDRDVHTGRPYYYYVLAENAAGVSSRPSNLARAPSLAMKATFGNLQDALSSWLNQDGQVPPKPTAINSDLDRARERFLSGDLEGAARQLERLAQAAKQGQISELPSWRAQDLEILTSKLVQRIRLAQAELVDPSELY
jgi:hypothetical protein